MTNLDLSFQLKVKRLLYLFVCVLVPFIYNLGYYEIGFYIYYTFIAIAFYEADHFNIRFIIGLVAVEEMFSQLSQHILIFFTRTVFGLEDFSYELFLGYFLQGFFPILMCFAILLRGNLVAWFREKTNSRMRYRLIGMEWLLFVSYLSVFILHVILLSLTHTSISNITGMQTLWAWYSDENVKFYIDKYDIFYMLITMMQLFAIQSYNYKRCRRVWFFKS